MERVGAADSPESEATVEVLGPVVGGRHEEDQVAGRLMGQFDSIEHNRCRIPVVSPVGLRLDVLHLGDRREAVEIATGTNAAVDTHHMMTDIAASPSRRAALNKLA